MINTYLLQQCPILPSSVIQMTKLALYEWNVAHSISLVTLFSGLPQEEWTPPPEGVFKLNFDGAVNHGNEIAGLRGIVRNHEREMMVAYSRAIEIVHPLEAELRALYEGVLICHKDGIK